MHFVVNERAVRALGVLTLFVALGCAGEKPSPPKTMGELSEQEKQQIRELNEQRASEWGTPKPSPQKQPYRK